MPNPTATGLSFANSNLVVHCGTTNFTFPYSGAVPVLPTDLQTLQIHEDATIASAVQQILQSIAGASQGVAQADPAPTGSTGTTTPTPPAPTGASMAVSVGPNQAIKEIADALPFILPGGTITVDDGTYLKPFDVSVPNVTFKSASGNPRKCVCDGQGGYGGGHRMAWGKAFMHFSQPGTVLGIGFRRCGSPNSGHDYSNEAAIYPENFPAPGGTMRVEGCAFDDNANAIFAPPIGNGGENVDLVSKGNVFGRDNPNGQNAAINDQNVGPAHDHYVCCRSVEAVGNWHGGCAGHSIKSRSPKTNVHDNLLLTGFGGRAVEATEGGALIVKNNVIWQRADGNTNCIAYADENSNQGVQTAVFDGNTFHIERLNTIIWFNAGSGAFTNTKINFYGNGSLVIQGNASGITEGSAPPGASASYKAPAASF